jgi:hypothetical protein
MTVISEPDLGKFARRVAACLSKIGLRRLGGPAMWDATAV